MFDLGASELLLIVVVAIIVIGPKDMPVALRTAGRWIGKMRRLSTHFRTGIDAMIREAEIEDMEKKWKAQNEKIMRDHPDGMPAEMEPTGALPAVRTAEGLPTLSPSETEATAEVKPTSVSAESAAANPVSVEPVSPERDESSPPGPTRPAA